MTKRVFDRDERGKVVQIFKSVSEAAVFFHVTRTTFMTGVAMGKKRDGYTCEVEGMGIKELNDMLEKQRMASNAWKRKKRAQDKKYLGWTDAVSGKDGLKEDLTPEEMDERIENIEKDGIVPEVVKYVKKWERVSMTRCMKRDYEKRPMVGTIGCVCCKYFRGRCHDRSEVICVFNHYQKNKRKM